MTTPAAADPGAMLDEVRRLREQTRRQAHAGAWFPVAALATLLLASIALYREPFAQSYAFSGGAHYWAGLPDADRSAIASYLFWFLGTPLTIALTGAWYRWRARRVGIRVPWRWFAITALGALAALAVIAAMPQERPADPDVVISHAVTLLDELRWGLFTPLMPIALAIIVLGWVERSRALVLSGVWVGVITFWQCSQGLGDLPGWLTWVLVGFDGPALGGTLTLFGLNRPGPTLILMALPLLAFAVVRSVRTRGGLR